MLKLGIEDDGGLDKFIDEVHEGAQAFLLDVGDEIFAATQIAVPVQKVHGGTLKKSGNKRMVMMTGKMMFFIGYNTTYALPVHDGFEAQTVTVREHSRRTKSGGKSTVREHDRRMKERIGRPYIDDPIKRVLASLPQESRDLISVERFRSDMLD